MDWFNMEIFKKAVIWDMFGDPNISIFVLEVQVSENGLALCIAHQTKKEEDPVVTIRQYRCPPGKGA